MKKENLPFGFPHVLAFIAVCFISLNLNGQTKIYSDTTYYYGNKNIRTIIAYNGDNKTETTYFENGYLSLISNFYKNNLNGQQQRWYDNGKQQSVSNYENGLIAHKTEWHSNGTLYKIENYIYLKIENEGLRQLYHGEYLHLYDNGNIKTRGQYDSGLMINQWETYFENGQKQIITNYTKGLKNGNETKWYSSGAIQSECTYITKPYTDANSSNRYNLDNERVDQLKRIGANGSTYYANRTQNYITLFDKKRISYFESGQKSLEYNYSNGMREGTFKEWHNNGKLKSIQEYKNNVINGKNYSYFYNGKPHQLFTEYKILNNRYDYNIYEGKYEIYYTDGKPQIIGNYKKGKLQGLYTQYYENGIKRSETNYIDGLKTGEEKYWHTNGKINNINTYKYFKINDTPYSQLEGIVMAYNSNGNVTQKSFYKNGKINGLREEWHTNGKKKSEIEYCNGEHCGIEKYWDIKGRITSEKKLVQAENDKNNYILAYAKEFKDSVLIAYYQYNNNGNLYNTNKYYDNGTLKSTIHKLSHGSSIYEQSHIERTIKYYDNGNIEYDGTNIKNYAKGIQFSYYIDGSPRLYTYNPVGKDSINVYINWTPSGQLLSHQNRANNYTNINDKKLEEEVFKFMVDYQKNKPQNTNTDNTETWQNSNKLIEIKQTNDSTLNYNAFYFNGKPFFAIQFKQHAPHGNYTLWAHNGIKLEEGQYHNGKKINQWVSKNFENKLQQEISYTLKDESAGTYKGYYDNGILSEEYTFTKFNKNGKLTSYYDNGKLHTEEYYKNGNLDSIAKTFSMNGNLIEYSEFKNRRQNSVTKQWAENGILISETYLKYSERDSIYKKWWSNGKLQVNGFYKQDKRDSIWSFYNINGKLILQEQYKRNESYPVAIYNAATPCLCQNTLYTLNKELPAWSKASEYNQFNYVRSLETMYYYQNKLKVFYTNYLTKKENNETVSTFNLILTEPLNARRQTQSQLIFNPCFSFENNEAEIPCTTKINDNEASITMQPKKLAIYFNYGLLREIEASNLKNQISELSNYSTASKLLFSVSSIAANNKKTTLQNVQNPCFTPSYIGYSGIQLAIDSAKIAMNSEFSNQAKPRFNYNVINNFNAYLYNNISNNYGYNETGNIEVLSNYATYKIPNRLFDTAFKDTSTFTNSNVLIQDYNIFGSIALKVQKVNDNVYTTILGNKNTALDLKQLKERFEIYNLKNFNTYFDPIKNELLLFFNYNTNNN